MGAIYENANYLFWNASGFLGFNVACRKWVVFCLTSSSGNDSPAGAAFFCLATKEAKMPKRDRSATCHCRVSRNEINSPAAQTVFHFLETATGQVPACALMAPEFGSVYFIFGLLRRRKSCERRLAHVVDG
ncbi:hypothetical protein HUK80_16290 [Flavobacterium sp. MAH-1]|uniref:Uncharacterized protein n=1 Tax=Flavobacterium agri TaxID=2743471 RepID=A0A7Y8Y502_9FLAO|nr:hypothetical protein [Flavobacterium agri]NUY82466.1 hypothetical protein [Flavobacterium agri]NYA72490.1 hypothetical protein [Flavobacterium agri]